MQKIYATPDLMLGGLVKSRIEARGIEVAVRNEYLNGALGELPAQDCWYEIWVADEDARAAAWVIARLEAPAEDGGRPWTCSGCGERIEAQFGLCWRCGAPPDIG